MIQIVVGDLRFAARLETERAQAEAQANALKLEAESLGTALESGRASCRERVFGYV